MHSGRLLRGINHTHIVLIPKVKCPMSTGQLRPISLCNVVYRVVPNVLANRLSECLSLVISPSQSVFVVGRLIQDNLLLGQGAINYLKSKRQGRQYGLALKLDMSKAYNRVEWEFVEQVMRKMGFCEKWIMECVSTPSFSVLINGASSGYIVPSRCLRQEDPLSPYLFNICTEGLSSMVSDAEQRGVRICRGALSISHLFFADDILMFAKATDGEAVAFRDILDQYGRASGHLNNFAKSSCFLARTLQLM